MKTLEVRGGVYAEAPDKHTAENRSQRYVNGTGLRRVENRSLQSESDWNDADFERYSEDNGRTWGEWRDVYRRGHEKKGDDEINLYYGKESFNPHFGHFVSVGMRRIFFGGHTEAYRRYWSEGESAFVDHCLMVVRADGEDERHGELIKYEEGAGYDPDNWRDPSYTDHNRAYLSNSVDVLESGEILFAISADIRSCCRIRGLDVGEVFPSCPNLMQGMIVVRGRFNESRGNYDLKFSRPIVISDLKSSRGVCEPEAVMLPSGRILAVFRGSNVESGNWNTRIEPGTPSHKWYCCSDDGGGTFTEPVPWHFDDRKVFYSPASISLFVKCEKNEKIYWIGNITGHDAYANHPRYPLQIAEVDERGLPVRETLATIDDRREGDGPQLQLSNFSILQDRETGTIELYLTKLGQREGYTWWADSWRYFIDVQSDDEPI